MKNGKMIKDIASQVIVALIIQLLLYGIVYVYSYFNKEKLDITVCSSTEYEKGYMTCINIKNYQKDKSIDSIVVWSDANIDLDRLNYKEIEGYDDKFIIKNVSPLYNGTIVVYSNKEINQGNTRFETKEKKTVKFINNKKEEITYYWKQVVLNVCIYIIIYTVMIFFINIYLKKQSEQNERQVIKLEEKCNYLLKKVDSYEEDKKEIVKVNLRIKLFLHRKLQDYAKELDFYKNLIKKIIGKKCNANDVCYEITKTLKTYRTIGKINSDELELDSLELSEFEKKELREELKK